MKGSLATIGCLGLLVSSAASGFAQSPPDNAPPRPILGSMPTAIDLKDLGFASSPATPVASDVCFPVLEDLFAPERSASSGYQLWARAEMLNWWFKGASSPPLVTTGPSDTLPALGRPGTQVLFGNQIAGDYHPGGRFTIGYGVPSCDNCDPVSGIELSYFFVSPRGTNFSAGSPGIPIISRPFYDVSSGVPVAVVEGVANPAGLGIAPVGGSVKITDPSRMYGFELNGLCNLCCDPCRSYRVDFIYGFRELSFDEDLGVTENLTLADGTGERIIVHDSFSTRNQFYGGQIGLRGERNWGGFFINGCAKVAFGDMHSEATISGFTTDSLPGFPTVTAPGGLLAQTTNSGYHASNCFCVIPEATLNFGCDITRWLRVSVGYDYLYISQVARPGNQIDPYVNANLAPAFAGGVLLPPTAGGLARPAFEMHRTDFWAQGINFTMELRW